MPIQLAMTSTYGRQEKLATVREESELEELETAMDCGQQLPSPRGEECCGRLTLLQPGGAGALRLPVQVQVFRTAQEHFAVIRSTSPGALGVLALRGSSCRKLGGARCGVEIRARGYGGSAFTFLCETQRDAERWHVAFSSSPLHRQCSLPVVEEDEEF